MNTPSHSSRRRLKIALDTHSESRYIVMMDQQPVAPTKSPEQTIIELRARVNAGHQLSRDEVREALAALRRNRLAAAEANGTKKRTTQPARSAGELLGMLKNTQVQS